MKLYISDFDYDNLPRNHIDSILFNNVADDGNIGDIIFVFGSKKSLKYRVPKAIQLYKEKRAPKILFSGGVKWDDQHDVEAKVMGEEARRQGVSEEDILVEPLSTNTRDNVLFSSKILEDSIGLATVRRILIVTTTYHMRRAFMTMKTYLPDSITYTFCPVDDQNTKRENWFLNEKGTARAREECKKIIIYTRNGQLRDFDIEVNSLEMIQFPYPNL
ncbi:YdcF family protein [Paenibacillus solanacearum]|nr:YdcF family protein [Paenibacillus solanacearum]